MTLRTHSLSRFLLLALALPAVIGAAEPAVQPAPTATAVQSPANSPADQVEITRLLDLAVAHGFPDAAGATIFQGQLLIRVPGARDGEVYTPPTEGFHLKLADGRWLAGFSHVLLAAEVDASRLTPLTPAAFLALACRPEHDPERERREAQEDRLTQLFPAAQRPAIRAGKRWAPLFSTLGEYESVQQEAVFLHLVRLGLPSAWTGLSNSAADQRLMAAMNLAPDTPPLVLTEVDRLLREQWVAFGLAPLQRALQEHHAGGDTPLPASFQVAALPALPVLVRQALQNWFCARVATPTSDLPAVRAVAGMQALLALDAPEEVRETARLLGARLDLPAQRPADASFALRVALWDPPSPLLVRRYPLPELARMDDSLVSPFPADLREAIRKAREITANPFTLSDLGALIALVGDTGASRWLDSDSSFMGLGQPIPRTVGDNALRIIASLLQIDPRAVVHRDPGEPWTPATRRATAEALQAWWREHLAQPQTTGQPLATALVATLPQLSPGSAGRLIQALPEAERAPLIAALAALWREHPPLTASPEELGEALYAVGDDPLVAEVVRTFPVGGKQRAVLAAWYARHGEDVHLDRLLDDFLASADQHALDQAPDDLDNPLAILSLAVRGTGQARLQRLLAVESGALDQLATQRVLMQATTDRVYPSSAMLLFTGHTRALPAGNEQPLQVALRLAILGDLRVAPAGLITVERGMLSLQIGTTSILVSSGRDDARSDGRALVLPPDLRICDLAAAAASADPRSWGVLVGGDQVSAFDLMAPVAQRDAVLDLLRERVHAAALTSFAVAQMPPTLLPKVGITTEVKAKSEF